MGLVISALCAPTSRAQPLAQPEVRDRQLRADSARIAKRARDLQATFERRRRHMLPKFYSGTAERCLIVGRFCEDRKAVDYVTRARKGHRPRAKRDVA
jgi:hypothetical protein